MNLSRIPKKKLENAFSVIGWQKNNANDFRYDIWVSKSDNKFWTVIPKDDNGEEYLYYQNKNLELLIKLLGLEYTEYNLRDVHSQLLGYNYKLINHIQSADDDESIPYEFAHQIPQKTIDSFRTFYNIKEKGQRSLKIDDFKLNHTLKGSFIIPVSISVNDNDSEQIPLFNMASKLNSALHEYLKLVDKISKLPTKDKDKFVSDAIEFGIESKIIKDFYGETDSIAKYKYKYANSINSFFVYGTSSPFLDYNLQPIEKKFLKVDLSNMETVPDEYIVEIEAREIEADEETIDKQDTNIEVMVDGVEFKDKNNHKAKFTVLSIDKKPMEKTFKAFAIELPKRKLDVFTDMLKSRNVLVIRGDVTKQKGKPGLIRPDELQIKTEQEDFLNELG